MSPMMLLFSLLPTILVLTAAVAFWLRSVYDGSRMKRKGLNLPPGTMGWPFLGETMAFMKTHSCSSLGEYLEDRQLRYGKIFKSHIFGKPTIISIDVEFNRFVLRNDGKLFESSFPQSVVDILGRTAMLVNGGEHHRNLKSLVLSFMGISRLRNHVLGDAERFVKLALDSWEENTPIHAQEEACKVAFHLMAKNIMSMNPGEPGTEELRLSFANLMKGIVAIPLNVPGTPFRKALKARASILRTVKRTKKERLEKIEMGTDEIGDVDLLGHLIKNSNLNAEEFGDLVLGYLFGGHETSTTAIAMAIYYLQDCPKAVEQLREEHLQIVKTKRQRGEAKSLTWEDYKQMKFTQCVVSETLRLGNIVRFVHRKACTDVHYKGYDIPTGWSIIPVLAAPHLDPSTFENHQKFDPWRWQAESIMSSARHEFYMPFSQGNHNCAGSELAKMEISVFIHHLVLNFDWELAEPDHPLSYAFPEFPKGLPIKVTRLELIE